MTRVSVVIPSYNRAHCLRETVNSVLSQTVTPFEVIVVDDGSTDATPSLTSLFTEPVRTIRKRNGGAASARNTGIAAARGDVIAFLDADDLWQPQKLEVQLAALAARPRAGWCITDHETTNLSGHRLAGAQGFARDFPAFQASHSSPEQFFAKGLDRLEFESGGSQHIAYAGDAWPLLFHGNFVFPSTAMIRRDVAVRAGPWDEMFGVAEDTEWFHRVAAISDMVVVLTPLMQWRRGQSNTLMSGANVVSLIRNAVISLDRAAHLRGDPPPAVMTTWRATRRRLLLELAYGHLSVLDGSGARSALREAMRAGARPSGGIAALWGASLLPPAALRMLHGFKRAIRRGRGASEYEPSLR